MPKEPLPMTFSCYSSLLQVSFTGLFSCVHVSFDLHGWRGEGLKLEVETEYTERLYSVSSDVSRFAWESLAKI